MSCPFRSNVKQSPCVADSRSGPPGFLYIRGMDLDWMLFDADHTLFDFDRSSQQALKITLVQSGVHAGDELWHCFDRINKTFWAAFERGELSREEMRLGRFSAFFAQTGIRNIDIEDFAGRYLRLLPAFPYFIRGAHELLRALHGRVRLGLVTNGLPEVQRPRLSATGIDAYFHVVVISGEIGYVKPDRNFFRHTHGQMGHPDKASVLLIGDSLHADIAGGTAFGFRTCWFNPARQENTSDISPDFEIDHLHAILGFLGPEMQLH